MTKKVIMIDDNEDDLLFTRIAFERCGRDAVLMQFVKAEDALAYLARGEAIEPALVMLDINMPGMNGFEFLEAYEQLPQGNRTSLVVVMLTSSNDERDKERAFQSPMVRDYVNKPIERPKAAQLLDLLER
ncbi:MAG: CheY-like chemotaxis protein [Hydrogenophaga sp.]|jgi:CheY-like chemotaxis protein